jgi:hypothetical protein
MTDTENLFEEASLPRINNRYIDNVLNELKKTDPIATEQLLDIKVPTNEKMRAHPTIHFYDDSLTIFGVLAGLASKDAPFEEGTKADPELIVDFFNRLLSADHEAVSTLINHRIKVNKELAEHPDFLVLVNSDKDGKPTNPRIGLLGILNAMAGISPSGWGRVGAEFDEEANIHRFVVPSEAE